ncbi:hypothetical protein D5041_15265 [Verminephrobacter aporrectodeae subsp. tuberculatae]|uniref:hypothetical protein n=1 Tax=Verminephrobacter aporrectodeae TaxID=1110389 RepID=UPI002237352E|nr:hypothetical protein [Verminephrobacter aporrectodeae]MCW5221060.1 hypothetical protein [Verminephrobacter aporrectodeae subsp. tuberculatae]MCW5290353.1 hypothetical protein [Verminephrobacter aporrectodeae subsp. tuberculatae]
MADGHDGLVGLPPRDFEVYGHCGSMTVCEWQELDRFDPEQKRRLARTFDRIALQNYQMNPTHFIDQYEKLFKPDTHLYLGVNDHAEIVAWSLVRQMEFEGIPLMYGWLANVVPSYQGMGFAKRVRDRALAIARLREPCVIYSTSTRNPVVYHNSRKICTYLLPTLTGDDAVPQDVRKMLLGAASFLAATVYERWTVDIDNLCIKNEMPVATYAHNESFKATDPFDRAFYAHPSVRNARDGMLLIGLALGNEK